MSTIEEGKKLSQLPVLSTINGEIWLEIIQRGGSAGPYTNFRIPLNVLKGLDGKDGVDGQTGANGLDGRSAYEIAVAHGYIGSETDWLNALKGIDGRSAYDAAVANGFIGSETEWLESLKGQDADNFDADGLQELLLQKSYSVKDVLKVIGSTSTVTARGGWFNFLFLFDPRVSTGDLTASGKPAQRVLEQGRMEAEGYSYWKNSKGPGTVAGVDPVPDSEIRLFDNGVIQVGSMTDFIELGDGGKITVVTESGSNTYDLSDMNQTPAGCVYITDVTPVNPVDNVGEKVRTADGHTLLECSSSTARVNVTVEALSGPTNFTPQVTLLGELNVPMSLLSNDGSRFRGTVAIDLDTLDGAPYLITATHGDGGEAHVEIKMEQAPVVTSAVFTGGYPNGQTELKAGDTVGVMFNTDVPVVAYQISDTGALTAKTGVLSAGVTHNLAGLTVANRGTTTQQLGFSVRVQTASGTWSDWFDSNTVDTPADGEAFVKLNNTFPVITFGGVLYPAGQGALGVGDAATVNHTVSNADVFSYSSNGQLAIANTSTFETSKAVNYVTGTYNHNTTNFTLSATRTANGAVTVGNTVVKIATVLPTINITTPAARLRSGGNAGTQVQNHTITLTSNQELATAPVLNAPEGNWVGNWTPNAARTVWTRSLAVHDNDAKGQFSFNSLIAVSLSGMEQSAINSGGNYTIGGFVFRTIQVAAFPNRAAAIGTEVTNTAKLRCTNLSKGASGSLNYTYQATTASAVNRYTVQNNTAWYNCDDANAVSNTGGLMQIELEEVV